MKLYTGYFDALEKYVKAGLNPISVAGWAPQDYKGQEWKFFAPYFTTYTKYKSGEYTEQQYTKEYIAKIEALDKTELKAKIDKIENSIFLCYEKEGFCHRHLLAEWLKETFGYQIEEFKLK